MQSRFLLWTMVAVLAAYTPDSWQPEAPQPESSLQARSGDQSGFQVKLAADLPAEQIYHQVRRLAEERLLDESTKVYLQWCSHGEKVAEFDHLRQCVAVGESIDALVPVMGLAGQSRTFSPWSRLRVNGQQLPMETDAATAPRGGPGEEVVLATGEVVVEQVDLSLPDRAGIGFRFVRYYRSSVDYDGPLGPGWDHNCNQRILTTGSSGQQRLVWFNGRSRVEFTLREGRWQPKPGAFYRLTVQEDSIVIETPQLVRMTFEPAKGYPDRGRCWRLAQIAGRHDRWLANVMKFRYWPGTDVLMAVEDPYGNKILFIHDSQGRLAALRYGGLLVTYQYDEQGRLSRVNVPRVAVELSRTEDICWQFGYLTGQDKRSWLHTITFPGGFAQRVYTYETLPESESYGRVLDVRLRSTGRADPSGELVWTFGFQHQADRRIVTYKPPKPNPEERWVFPALAEPVACYPLEHSVPARKSRWYWRHNDAGQRIEEITPLGRRTRWEYDSNNPDPRFRGNLLAKREQARPGPNDLAIVEKGVEWQYHRQIAIPVKTQWYERRKDGKKIILLTTETELDPVSYDVVLERTGVRTTRTVRNRHGLPVVRWDGRGCATVFRYYERFDMGSPAESAGGLLAETISDAAMRTVTTALRRVAYTGIKIPERHAEGNPCEQLSRYRYDRWGRAIGEDHPGYRILRLWNKMHNLLAVLDTRSGLTVYDYDQGLRQVAEWQQMFQLPGSRYQGEHRADVEGRFRKAEFRYDGFGRLVAWKPTSEKFGPDGSAVAEVRYEYYPGGQVRKRTAAAGRAVFFQYDPHTGWLQQIQLVSSKDEKDVLVLRDKMTYDAEGFLVEWYDARGERHKAEPDAFGRQFKTVRPDGVQMEQHFDGLDRLVKEQTEAPRGTLLGNVRYEYDATGRLVRVLERRISLDDQSARVDEWLVAEENVYDAEDNVTRRRSHREDAWTQFGYDGLGRVVWREEPGGDREEIFYQSDYASVIKQLLRAGGSHSAQQTYILHTVILRDDRGHPWCMIPIGNDGTVGFGRAVVTWRDHAGQPTAEIIPGLKKTQRFYNTLGLLEKELVTDARTGAIVTQTVNYYDPDGLLRRREVFNEPLVLEQLSPRQPMLLNVRRQPVAQIYRREYDGFRRLLCETLPDGQQKQYSYRQDSLLHCLTLVPAQQEQNEQPLAGRQVLEFRYDRLGRLEEIHDAAATRMLQRFEYDWLGNITRAADYTQPEHPVVVRRQYDNLGQILWEQVILPEDEFTGPLVKYEYALTEGWQSISIENMLSEKELGWHKLVGKTDFVGRVRELQKDGEPFCHFAYVGQQQVSRYYPGYQLREQVVLNAFLEPVTQQARVDPRQAPIYESRIARDRLGRIAAYATRVPSRQWECTQIYDRDAAGNIIAEDRQGRYIAEELQAHRARMLETPGSAAGRAGRALGAWHVRRYVYDQAGNMMASYRGPVQTQWPEGAQLASAAPPVVPTGVASSYSARVHQVSLGSKGNFGRQVNLLADRPVMQASLPEEYEQLLASNRTTCQAELIDASNQLARATAEYDYDGFGRLTSYRSQATGQTLKWQIDYDIFGRVERMEGSLVDSSQASNAEKPDRVLSFAYDPFNRRILKAPENGKPELALYFHTRPLVKLSQQRAGQEGWIVKGQYLWGPLPSQSLAYYERRIERDSANTREYLLHQDQALNVFMATFRSEDRLRISDITSYWTTGENSTQAIIRDVKCSLKGEAGRDPKWTMDRVFDSNVAYWFGSNRPGCLTVELARPQRLALLSIWASRLPERFRVYAVDAHQVPRSGGDLKKWEQEHNSKQVGGEITLVSEPDSHSDREISTGKYYHHTVTRPLELPLRNRKADAIVLVWDTTGDIAIRELEVFVQPEHPGDLAFSGTIYDAETGLYYHGARYRLPQLGKFISPDPLGFLGGDNLYAFANNDPLTWHDPDGQFAHVIVGAGAGAAFGAGTYVLHWLWHGEEFDWRRLAIYTGAGAASGAIGALTFGAAAGILPSGTLYSGLAGCAAGAAGAATHGLLAEGGITLLETGDLSQALDVGLRAAGHGAVIGAVSGFAGGTVAPFLGQHINKAVNPAWARGLLVSMGTGATAGAAGGAVSGAYYGYRQNGWKGAFHGFIRGGVSGAVFGALAGATVYGIGKGIDRAIGAKWTQSRQQYWKRQAARNPDKYSPENLARMQRGKAPLLESGPDVGKPMELHHRYFPQRSGLPRSIIDQPFNLDPLTPSQHRAVHYP